MVRRFAGPRNRNFSMTIFLSPESGSKRVFARAKPPSRSWEIFNGKVGVWAGGTGG